MATASSPVPASLFPALGTLSSFLLRCLSGRLLAIFALKMRCGQVPRSLRSVAPSADARIVIKNVRLFTGEEVINSGVLVLKAGKIVSVLHTDQAAGETFGDKDVVIDGAFY